MSHCFRPLILLSRMAYGLSFNSNLASSVVGGLSLTKESGQPPSASVWDLPRTKRWRKRCVYTRNSNTMIQIGTNTSLQMISRDLLELVLTIYNRQSMPSISNLQLLFHHHHHQSPSPIVNRQSPSPSPWHPPSTDHHHESRQAMTNRACFAFSVWLGSITIHLLLGVYGPTPNCSRIPSAPSVIITVHWSHQHFLLHFCSVPQ